VIALDTNVIVRYLVRDDAKQLVRVAEIFKRLTVKKQGFISREVLLELVWVLERQYKYSRDQVASAIFDLLSSKEIMIEVAGDVGLVLERYVADGFDFADLMINAAAHRSGARELVTFDRKAARLVGVRLL